MMKLRRNEEIPSTLGIRGLGLLLLQRKTRQNMLQDSEQSHGVVEDITTEDGGRGGDRHRMWEGECTALPGRPWQRNMHLGEGRRRHTPGLTLRPKAVAKAERIEGGAGEPVGAGKDEAPSRGGSKSRPRGEASEKRLRQKPGDGSGCGAGEGQLPRCLFLETLIGNAQAARRRRGGSGAFLQRRERKEGGSRRGIKAGLRGGGSAGVLGGNEERGVPQLAAEETEAAGGGGAAGRSAIRPPTFCR